MLCRALGRTWVPVLWMKHLLLKVSAKAHDTQWHSMTFTSLCVVGEYFTSGVFLGGMCLVGNQSELKLLNSAHVGKLIFW